MKTPVGLALALIVAAALSGPALADKGGNGNGNANGHDKSDNSGGTRNNGNGYGSSNGNTKNSSDNGQALAVEGDGIVAVPDDQEVVQNAVRAKAALSLEAITAVVLADTDGRILDLQLVTFKGIYLYDVTVLEKDGVLHKLYYNARSGARVRTN